MELNYKTAEKALQTAKEKALSLNIPVTIAVVDMGGHLIALARLDSVYGVIDFAVKKARTAAMFGVNTEMMGSIISETGIHGYGMLNSNEGLLTIAGGIVLQNAEGKIIGAIGSSGGSPEQDKEIAEAGAQAIA
ncbi:heme-binding protein [Chryseobacterium sp. PCH239]|uniref:GlcG/HbpS family heme-binding protein n=1 Tax=Chryseobacterium sp. PCH239 TaxID=2825845 RepID=UPI001C101E71|nr:heme-binding protein [Chryseobacterium sp. PCH239]QWT86889.1 heme-binding protein [Chryseobacterium sp. PCH239]